MNTKEYIESGVIETYVLGMLTDAEASEVKQMAQKHPEVQQAIDEMRASLEGYATAHSVAPKPEWKDEILAAALAANNSQGQKSTPTKKDTQQEPVVRTMAPAENKKSGFSPIAIAASVALLISLGYNAMQYQSIQDKEEEISKTQLRVAELESENEVMVANFEDAQSNLAVLRDAGTATFIMKAIEGRDPQYRADVHWNSTSEIVYLDVKALPDAPQGMQYQLWALKDGKPIDMGVFNADDTKENLMAMGKVPGADAFAVTLEKAGGAPSPTMEQMYVYGTPVAG
ncbi:anti-sigma factor domain-containing protein [Owenweeksia hongkongensis]|uniref:anti-sigma factor n=1 Tax=Owenweeksia hongkongensis TaxID=253245 RepID=UPI003A909B3B